MSYDQVTANCIKRERALRRGLEDLCRSNYSVMRALDKEMKKPSDVDRGKRIAEIVSHLELKTDFAMHFDLNYGFKKISNAKAKP